MLIRKKSANDKYIPLMIGLIRSEKLLLPQTRKKTGKATNHKRVSASTLESTKMPEISIHTVTPPQLTSKTGEKETGFIRSDRPARMISPRNKQNGIYAYR